MSKCLEELRDRWKTEKGKKCLRNVLKAIKAGKDDWQKWLLDLPRQDKSTNDRDLRAVNLSNADLAGIDLSKTDLSNADLGRADLNSAILNQANLSEVNLAFADLSFAELTNVNLRRADIRYANLNCVNLSNSNLSGAKLCETNLSSANLDGVNLHNALVGYTTFAGNDLRTVKGLAKLFHEGPSFFDIDTICKSKGRIPKIFLMKAGMPKSFIDNIKSLVNEVEDMQLYSCFISYCSKDEAFAQYLYKHLQKKNVRCWFAPENMQIGDRIRRVIDQTISNYDKLLLILSNSSINSHWVEQEVETALEKERTTDSTVLFPIRLDDSIFNVKAGWASFILRTRNIGNFSNWKNRNSFKKSFDKLMLDLRTSEKTSYK